jgi:hypothetical protein
MPYLGQPLINQHATHILMFDHKPGMISIPKLDFGDRVGGTETSILGWWLRSGGTREGKLRRCYWNLLESMAEPVICR